MSTQNANRARIARYRGPLSPLHVVGRWTLSRSERNGNYYLTVGNDVRMVSSLEASQFLSRHDLPQFSDTAMWVEKAQAQS